MQKEKKTFNHFSLQDKDSIAPLLHALSTGLQQGKMVFSDEEDEITLHPSGLLNLKVSASESSNKHQIEIKISWNITDKKNKKNILTIQAR